VDCGVAGACCSSDCPEQPDTDDCQSVQSAACARGYFAVVDSDIHYTTGGGNVIFFGPCLKKYFINPDCPNARTSYTDKKVCRCTSFDAPHIPQDWADAGFTGCIRNLQDPRSWGEACAFPVPDTPCRTRGAPVILDDDTTAHFWLGERRVDTTVDYCVGILGDVYVDGVTSAQLIACPRNDQVLLGRLYQEECAAMYAELEYDVNYVC